MGSSHSRLIELLSDSDKKRLMDRYVAYCEARLDFQNEVIAHLERDESLVEELFKKDKKRMLS